MFNFYRPGKMRKLFLVVCICVVGLFQSCGPVEEVEPRKRNELVMNNSSYTISYATVYDQGTDLSEEPPLRKYQMTFASSQTLAAARLKIALYSADTKKIKDGTYTNGTYGAGNFYLYYIDYGLVYDVDGIAVEGKEYNSWDIDSNKESTITVSSVGQDKEYEFVICLDNGDTLQGYYKGALESLNY